MRSNPSLSPILKPNNIIQYITFLLASLLYGFNYIIQCIKMITKSSPLCSILVVLWFGIGFGSKLGSKPARNLTRNASKFSTKLSFKTGLFGYMSVVRGPLAGFRRPPTAGEVAGELG